MKKTLKKSDPRLTAYALGELSGQEAEEIAQQLENAPDLREEVEQIDALSIALMQGFGKQDEIGLSEQHRHAIFQSGKEASIHPSIATDSRQWIRPTVVILGAAALLMLTFVILNNIEVARDFSKEPSFAHIETDELLSPILPNQSRWKTSSQKNKISTASSHNVIFNDRIKQHVETIGDGLMHHPQKLRQEIHTTANLNSNFTPLMKAQFLENAWQDQHKHAIVRLPLVCGNSSWKWIKQWTNSNHSEPIHKNAIRIEEILNHFSYSSPSDLKIGNLQAGINLAQCPWNPQHQVAVILVQNQSQADSYAEAAITTHPAIKKYRLIGYAKATDPHLAKVAPARIKLAPGYSHLVMYEIQPTDTIKLGDKMLTLTLHAENEKDSNNSSISSNSLTFQYSNLSWEDVSQDMQFSLILASWAQYIQNSNFTGVMNPEKIAAMLNYFESNHTPSNQQKSALEIIKLNLKKRHY